MTSVRFTRPAVASFRHHESRDTTGAIPIPAWVNRILGSGSGDAAVERRVDGVAITVQDRGTLALCSAVVEDAADLCAHEFRGAVTSAYGALFRSIDDLAARHPVRMWNFIPDIHGRRGDGLSTYYVFNQARIEAFGRVHGAEGAVEGRVPTATGVGHMARDFVVHCLSSAHPGEHLENPRQIPACRYSTRYGPKPPCFARGTIASLKESRLLFVGGTASIRNEVSLHAGDLSAQIDETFENLAALLRVARNSLGSRGRKDERNPLCHLVNVRVYSPDPTSERALMDEVVWRLGTGVDVEFVHAQLCREELLVEIEGVADLSVDVPHESEHHDDPSNEL